MVPEDVLAAGQTTGRIFAIQRYSLHDGDGIRTIVFCKGCSLRCRWCCNPEGQEKQKQIMRLPNETQTAGQDVTAAQVMDIVERDRPFYRRSGGGLTLSGGEILCQPSFALALLRIAKHTGISTAIETAAFAPSETIKPLLPLLDQCLLDIKHMDPVKHKAYTGQPNALILNNTRLIAAYAYASQTLLRLTIRVPVIPGFNDTEEEIRAIARFVREIFVDEIHLLPYHRLGAGKYEALGRSYPMGDTPPPDEKKMQRLQEIVSSIGNLNCQIGG
jgi:pyruvate formate lyase activating enzyme